MVIVVVDVVVMVYMVIIIWSFLQRFAYVGLHNAYHFAPFCFFENFLCFDFSLSVFLEKLKFARFRFLELHGEYNEAKVDQEKWTDLG